MPSFKNPFGHEQSLQQWIESDDEYQNLFRKHKEVVRSNIIFTQSLPFYMKLTNTLKRTLAYVGAHTAVAVIIGLLAVSTITASAAELVAPTEFKPSTLIKGLFQPTQNLQTETDPDKELVEDPANNIVKLDQCGIAIKYPKQINENAITSNILKDHQSPTNKQTLSISALNNVSDKSSESSEIKTTQMFRSVYVNCSSEKFNQAKGPNDEEKELSKETLKSYTGWLFADADIQNLTDLFNTKSRSHLVRFSFEDNWYAIGFTEQEQNNTIVGQDGTTTYGLFGNQIQIQLASQVDNLVLTTPLPIIKNAPQPQNPQNDADRDNPQLLPSEKVNVSNFSACTTSVQYPTTTDQGTDLTLRYVTNEDGSLSTTAVEFIARSELDNGDNLPTLRLECSKTPFEVLPNAQVISNTTKDGLFFTKESLEKATIDRISQIDNLYGISLNSSETQLENRIITDFSLYGMYFRQTESVFIVDTTGIDYSLYPFFYTRRQSPGVSFQSTQVVPRPINEKLTTISTTPLPVVALAPAKASSFVKTYNNQIDNSCALDGTVNYSTVSIPIGEGNSDKLAQMSIANRLQAKTEDSKLELGLFDSFMNKTKNSSSSGLFSNYCSGFYSFYMYDLPVTYSGTDSVRAAVFQEGNGIGGQAIVRIYATKGKNVIELNKSVIAIDYPTESAFYEPLVKSCSSTTSSDEFQFDNDCYDNQIKNNATIKSKAQSAIQELMTLFAL